MLGLYDEKNNRIEFMRFQPNPNSNDALQRSKSTCRNVSLYSLSDEISNAFVVHVARHSTKINIPAMKVPEQWKKPSDVNQLARRSEVVLRMMR